MRRREKRKFEGECHIDLGCRVSKELENNATGIATAYGNVKEHLWMRIHHWRSKGFLVCFGSLFFGFPVIIACSSSVAIV